MTGHYTCFEWDADWAALPVEQVSAVLDDPVYGLSPWSDRSWRRLLAHRGELCPVLEAPGLPETPTPGETALVLLAPEGNVALRLPGPPRLVAGNRQHDEIRQGDFRARIWSRERLLERLRRSPVWPR